MKAIYPGSFDPITNGHLDILERSLEIFDEVIVLVAGTGHKAPLFNPEERVEIIRSTLPKKMNVKVDRWSGLVVDYARKHKISTLIRGLRAASDFEFEFMMAAMNKNLEPKIETLFMMTSQHWYFVSSTMIKELARYGGDISPYVSKQVVKAVKSRRFKNEQ